MYLDKISIHSSIYYVWIYLLSEARLVCLTGLFTSLQVHREEGEESTWTWQYILMTTPHSSGFSELDEWTRVLQIPRARDYRAWEVYHRGWPSNCHNSCSDTCNSKRPILSFYQEVQRLSSRYHKTKRLQKYLTHQYENEVVDSVNTRDWRLECTRLLYPQLPRNPPFLSPADKSRKRDEAEDILKQEGHSTSTPSSQ